MLRIKKQINDIVSPKINIERVTQTNVNRDLKCCMKFLFVHSVKLLVLFKQRN